MIKMHISSLSFGIKMASPAIPKTVPSDYTHPFEFQTSIKSLVDSSNINSLPAKFNLDTVDTNASSCNWLPVIDFTALTSSDPDERSAAVSQLDEACADSGFFILVNHGIPEELVGKLFATLREFFYLPDEAKKQYLANSKSSPIACGNLKVLSISKDKFTLWRDFLTLSVHPEFNCPSTPEALSELVKEYAGITRDITRKLMGAVSEALGLDPEYVEEVLDLKSSFQKIGTSFYPPCPQPDKTIGLPPHTDIGLFTILRIHNELPGLQLHRHGQWIAVNPPKNCVIVNAGDQLEIFTNGRYKSSKHRAVVSKQERMSIAVGNGPGKEVAVQPAAPLVERDGRALFRAMNYREYVDWQFSRPYNNGITPVQELMIPHDHDHGDQI